MEHGFIMRLAAQVRRPRPHARVMFSVGVAVGGVVVARLLGSVVQIMLARWMGVADFGLYTPCTPSSAPW